MVYVHSRVAHGSIAQIVAYNHLVATHPTCTVISSASPGSNAPDIIATVRGVRIQCEVKSSFSFTSPIVTINKTVKRGHITIVDHLVPVITTNEWDSIETVVDAHCITDNTIGYPGDMHTPNSGKLPKCLKIDDPKILMDVRSAILSNLCSHNDTYFIIVTKRPTQMVHVFYTGCGENILNASPLPMLSMAKLRTYGTARKNSMRVALKVSFILPH